MIFNMSTTVSGGGDSYNLTTNATITNVQFVYSGETYPTPSFPLAVPAGEMVMFNIDTSPDYVAEANNNRVPYRTVISSGTITMTLVMPSSDVRVLIME